MLSWLISKFRKPPETPPAAAPAKVWRPEDVIADDPAMARVVAACMNNESIVFGEIDDRGNLTMTDERGRAIH